MLTTRALNPSFAKLFERLDAQRDFAAGGQQKHVGLAAGSIGKHVRASGKARGGRKLRAVERGKSPGASGPADAGSCCKLHDDFPRLDDFIGVRRAQNDQAGRGAEHRQMFDRLMRGPVFADANRIMRENVDHGDSHDGAQAQAAAHVIRENKEGRAERDALSSGSCR